MNIISILQSKGYSGSEDFFEIVEWFNSKKVYLDLQTMWDENDNVTGYSIVFWTPPHQSSFSTSEMSSFKDALYAGIVALKDYF